MKIIRILDTSKATYDIMGLSRGEFEKLLSAYGEHVLNHFPEDSQRGNNELLDKLIAMENSDNLSI